MRAVILDNLRSAYNVGSVFRTAAALDYDEVLLCGVTITPPAPKLKDTSRGMEEQVQWASFHKTNEAFEYCQKQGYRLVALETEARAQCIRDLPKLEHCAFILGNEAHGLNTELLDQVDHIASLPMLNSGTSINVSCAFSASAYQDYFINQG